MAEKTIQEVVLAEVRKQIGKDGKIREISGNTGISFFEGKKRLCKLLNTKKGMTLEVNVNLPKSVEKKFILTKITYAEAHKKHLGTMKYYVRNISPVDVPSLVRTIVERHRMEINGGDNTGSTWIDAPELKQAQPAQPAQPTPQAQKEKPAPQAQPAPQVQPTPQAKEA